MQTLPFSTQHGAMALKYAGISFISGAVNHGFFSGMRSLWTAAIGVVLFIVGAWLLHRKDEQVHALRDALVWGTLLSIGLGFFTGGLQHFPDSPERSSWVVPLGFVLSIWALAQSEHLPKNGRFWRYGIISSALMTTGSVAALMLFQNNPQWMGGGHHHGPSDVQGPSALVVDRSIEVRMDDAMRFYPDKIAVSAGETVRFVLHNSGNATHEMVIGSAAELAQHAQEMKAMAQSGAAHAHGESHGLAITLVPGQTREWVVRFEQATELGFACLIPGHFEAGMKGQFVWQDAKDGSASPAPKKRATAEHDHSSHKH
jgi:uncharacterized cupredoxin-like copper-binding protein